MYADSRKSLKSFVRENKIKARVEWADSNPHMTDFDGNHFKVTLRHGNRQYTLFFSQGYGISGEPSAADVLDCLACDSASLENARSFEDWAEELGYDSDSRKAEKIYKACEKEAANLRRLLGDSLFEKLLWDTERL